MSYDNTNRGSIWPNERREKDTHPDFRGTLNADGVEYWVSAWKRRPDANPRAPSLTFSIQKKETKPEPSKAEMPREFDDEIPF